MFTLITLVDACPSDRYFHRHILRTYSGFNSMFRPIDIRKYRACENTAEVTILDRFAMFAVMYYELFPLEELLKRLEGTKNLIFMTSDLHYWSILPDLITSDLVNHELSPDSNNYERLFEMFDQLNIRHLITCYDCPELRQIQSLRADLRTYVLNLHVDTNVFKDYGLNKTHDIIIYGSSLKSAYPFRHRLAQLLLESGKFDVLRIELNEGLYDPEKCGEGLARKINQSWLGLATVSAFDYLVGRYFEIPACRSVVLGDMNEQGRAIFGNHYVHVDETMSDAQILSVVERALGHRKWLQEQADCMYRVMHEQYTMVENERKLFQIARDIANRTGLRFSRSRKLRTIEAYSDREL
jgi:hypothetical protein